MRAVTPDELRDLITVGYERRGIEFKGPGSLADRAFAVKVVRAVLGMSNRRDGGFVVIGVDEQGRGLLPTGLSESDRDAWNFDDASAFFAPYADPSVSFELEHIEYDGKWFLALRVHEFEDVPVLCARAHEPALRQGACYVRSRRKPETSEIPSQTEMRELIELATEKRLRELIGTMERAGVELPSRKPSDSSKFDEQIAEMTDDAPG